MTARRHFVAVGLGVLAFGVLVEAVAAFHLFFHQDPFAGLLIVASWFREAGKDAVTKLLEDVK